MSSPSRGRPSRSSRTRALAIEDRMTFHGEAYATAWHAVDRAIMAQIRMLVRACLQV